MTYLRGLVTFVDILGFRALVNNDPTGNKVQEVFKRLRRYGTEDLFGVGKARDAKYLHFSDSIVRVTPLTGGDGWQSDRAAILHELESLTYIQGELAATGVFLRGGIACGSVHADDSGVFGPAFIEAYALESQLALYPRIILHPDLMKEHQTEGKRGQEIYADDDLPLTRVGSDGLHFIDYLANFPREVHSDPSPEREEIAESYIRPRKALVARELNERQALDPIRTKYTWLGRYHNEVVSELLGSSLPELLADC